MDAILFSADPEIVRFDDARRHLADHDELYWEVGFKIKRENFSYPMLGYIHVCRSQVEYVATIKDIVPFSPSHYEDKDLAARVKPLPWRREWAENINDIRTHHWKSALVITALEPFLYDTFALHQLDGRPVTKAPQNYTRILQPGHQGQQPAAAVAQAVSAQPQPSATRKPNRPLAERNLEHFVLAQLDAVEPGLKLVNRQLSTPAGRLDILCQDQLGWYVVVELKREQGTDSVVGQILRYMGWAKEHYQTDKVRGIIIVARKDTALEYASKAATNLLVKEFKLFIE